MGQTPLQITPAQLQALSQPWQNQPPGEALQTFAAAGGVPEFMLLVFTEQGSFHIQSAANLAEMRDRLRPLRGRDAHAFAFLGHQFPLVLRGTELFLRTPAGDLPLTEPEPARVVTDGFLSAEATELAPIPVPVVPEPPERLPVELPVPAVDDAGSDALLGD